MQKDTIALTKPIARKLMWISYALALGSIIFMNLLSAVVNQSSGESKSVNIDLLIVSAVLTLLVHELLHGAVLKAFGAKIAFHVRLTFKFLPHLYTDAPGQTFSINEQLVVGMFPLVFLDFGAIATLLIVPRYAVYATVVFVINTAGSAADLYILRKMIAYKKQYTKAKFINGEFILLK